MIAYDTNVLIYAFESDTEWSQAARQIVKAGERDGAVLSVLAWQEVLTGAVLHGKSTETAQRQILQSLEGTKFVPVTTTIANSALALTRKFGRKVKGYDAILLATAIEHGATVFYTNDTRLQDLKLKEIKIRGLVTL